MKYFCLDKYLRDFNKAIMLHKTSLLNTEVCYASNSPGNT